ncbi:hypothetical protein BMF94_6482 [Rhodotorula taiwanensis]|uniref:Uncharacterized protein n=1 Tax=Rhodotorula taiwanensis TaxID=741276 RepID=A0A2S5B1B0_9BASI|nr:hypothetical protein BMF94_6482 [Rhodotorula taiwanensis]
MATTAPGQPPHRQSYLPQQPLYALAQPIDEKRRTGNFSNAFLAAPAHNGQHPVDRQREQAYRASVYAQPQPHRPVSSVQHGRSSAAYRDNSPARVERPPRQASMMVMDQQQHKIQMQQYAYEQSQRRRSPQPPPPPPPPSLPPFANGPPDSRQAFLHPRDQLSLSVPLPSDQSSSSLASNSPTSTSVSPQPSDDKGLSQQQNPRPKRPTAPLCPPFDMEDWAITDATLPSCVSPAVFLLWQASPLSGRDAFETVFVDAQTRRVAFVAREYVRGTDGVLRRGGVVDDETRDLSSKWHESDGAEASSAVERLEWLLLSVPSARERERGSDQLGKVGLVTNENLYLPAGKVVRWKKFYKKSFFADEKEEPTWQGIGGTKYRWAVREHQTSMCHLIDHRTKEILVTVRERPEKPTQIIISALAQPSIQPILLTLLHRTFTNAEKERSKDQQAWEDEEVVRW